MSSLPSHPPRRSARRLRRAERARAPTVRARLERSTSAVPRWKARWKPSTAPGALSPPELSFPLKLTRNGHVTSDGLRSRRSSAPCALSMDGDASRVLSARRFVRNGAAFRPIRGAHGRRVRSLRDKDVHRTTSGVAGRGAQRRSPERPGRTTSEPRLAVRRGRCFCVLDVERRTFSGSVHSG
jgi:hypothetical protein